MLSTIVRPRPIARAENPIDIDSAVTWPGMPLTVGRFAP